MGSANPKSIEALRWAAMQDAKITAAAVVKQSFEEHNPQLYLALALLCKGCALVTVKNTDVNRNPAIAERSEGLASVFSNFPFFHFLTFVSFF